MRVFTQPAFDVGLDFDFAFVAAAFRQAPLTLGLNLYRLSSDRHRSGQQLFPL
jgi:hypothetical protein